MNKGMRDHSRALMHALNAIWYSIVVGDDGTPRARTDCADLFRWVDQNGMPLTDAQALVERALESGMAVDLGGVEHKLAEIARREREAKDGRNESADVVRDSTGLDNPEARARETPH